MILKDQTQVSAVNCGRVGRSAQIGEEHVSVRQVEHEADAL